MMKILIIFFFSSRRRHTRCGRDWSSDVCSSDLGYGMTECGPLISYVYWSEYRKRSSGQVVDRMQAKIDSEDEQNIVGEILVKGSNLMLGYYKNEKATKETFTEDAWLKTGDLGTIDSNNYIYI